MKIAILGAGFTGLAAAYYLAKKGHSVTLFEKDSILGGLASGFKSDGWDWSLERAYHHIFASDNDIIGFAKEIGFNDIFFQEPETASLYRINPAEFPHLPAGRQVIPVDTPQDFLRFPLLPLPEKLRSAFVLAFLKFSPHLSLYDKKTAEEFLKSSMGNKAWNVLWKELFRKKFGKYAGNITAAFIWARINKRTKKLGYVKGGFQKFIDHIALKDIELGVKIQKETAIEKIKKFQGGFSINGESFDAVVSTLPTPVLTRLAEDIFPERFIKQLEKLKYLHAVNLILETDRPLLKKTYWLNICINELPFMVVVQHTNFIDRDNYGEKHIAYVARYVDAEDKVLKMTKEELLNYWLPHLKKTLNSQFSISNSFLFKAPFAQPIFDRELVKNKPDFKTPAKNFFIANLDMTYPYDRGTNFAVKLGKEVSQLL